MIVKDFWNSLGTCMPAFCGMIGGGGGLASKSTCSHHHTTAHAGINGRITLAKGRERQRTLSSVWVPMWDLSTGIETFPTSIDVAAVRINCKHTEASPTASIKTASVQETPEGGPHPILGLNEVNLFDSLGLHGVQDVISSVRQTVVTMNVMKAPRDTRFARKTTKPRTHRYCGACQMSRHTTGNSFRPQIACSACLLLTSTYPPDSHSPRISVSTATKSWAAATPSYLPVQRRDGAGLGSELRPQITDVRLCIINL
jgi:hypothetical protein